MRDAALVGDAKASAWRLPEAGQLCALATDAFVAPYAAFTLAVNAAVLLGLPAGTGLSCAGIALLIAMVALALVVVRPAWRRAYLEDVADEPVSAAFRAPRSIAIVLGVAPGIAIATWLLTRNPWWVWTETVLAFGAAAALGLLRAREPLESGAPEPVAQVRSVWLIGVGLVCAALALLVVRPRTDDAFYLNMAVAAVDFPRLQLLSLNTVHGLPEGSGLPVQHMFPPYRVHSFELLGALLARLSGIDATSVIHLGFTPLFALLAPLAIARLLRVLTPRHWLAALLVVLSFYWLEGTASRGYANQAFVRLFNGKSVLLTLGVPLLCVYGLRFGARPTRARFAWLAAAQITAVGLSSTGLWLAPTLAVIAVAAAAPLRKLAGRALLAVASGGYVLALGIWVAVQMAHVTGASAESADESNASDDAVDESPKPKAPSDRAQAVVPDAHAHAPSAAVTASAAEPWLDTYAEALPAVIGPQVTALGLFAAFACAAFAARTALAFRLLTWLGLLVSALFANPALTLLVERNITGHYNFQRVFWLLPIPIAIGLLASHGYGLLRLRMSAPLSRFVTACAVATFYLVISRQPVISEANHATVAFPPAVKLWPHARDLAQAVCRHAPSGRHVLAPLMVSHVLPTLHRCGHPLIADTRWLDAPSAERDERIRLVRTVGAHTDLNVERIPWFIGALRRYKVDAVVVLRDAVPGATLKSALRWAGFSRSSTLDFSQIWLPESRATVASAGRVAQLVCKRTPKQKRVLAPLLVMSRIERADCAEPVLHAAQSKGPITPAVLDALELERLMFTTHDLEDSRALWFRDTIGALDLGAVAMSPAARANRKVAAALRELGFVPLVNVDGYRLLTKPVPAVTR